MRHYKYHLHPALACYCCCKCVKTRSMHVTILPFPPWRKTPDKQLAVLPPRPTIALPLTVEIIELYFQAVLSPKPNVGAVDTDRRRSRSRTVKSVIKYVLLLLCYLPATESYSSSFTASTLQLFYVGLT